MNAVISTNEMAWILTGHVTFKLRYNQIYQMKTTYKAFFRFLDFEFSRFFGGRQEIP